MSSVIPASYEVSVKTDTTKAITALAFDLQGAKFAIGTYSYSVSIYEFQRMDSSMSSFRQIYPCERFFLKLLFLNCQKISSLLTFSRKNLEFFSQNF